MTAMISSLHEEVSSVEDIETSVCFFVFNSNLHESLARSTKYMIYYRFLFEQNLLAIIYKDLKQKLLRSRYRPDI